MDSPKKLSKLLDLSVKGFSWIGTNFMLTINLPASACRPIRLRENGTGLK